MSIRPTGPCPARIMIIDDAPGEREEKDGIPLVGYAGREFSQMLQEAGIMRSECFITSVLTSRPPHDEATAFIAETKKEITGSHVLLRDKFVLPPLVEGIERLKREIELCRPHLIIALGNIPLWALTGQWGITSWRGSVMQCDLDLGLDYRPKVIPVYHPSLIMRQWSWRQICVHDLRRAKLEAKSVEINLPDYSFVTRPDYSTAVSVLAQLYAQVCERSGKLAVDIETRAGHIACIGIAWSTRDAICIPLMDSTKPEGYWPLGQELQLMDAMRRLLTHENCGVVGQNFLYDAQYFWRHLHYVPNVKRDTMIAQHVLFSNLPKDLSYLSSMYCSYHTYWKDEGKEWSKVVNEDQLWTYNCKDAVITFEVDSAQAPVVDAMKLRAPHDFQQKLFWPVLRTMDKGLRVDHGLKGRFAMMLQDEIAKREQWLIDVLGMPLNIKSSVQMKELFYGILNQKPVYNRKTGAISCDDEALRKIADREILLKPVVRKISELRSLGVFLSTFVNAPVDVDGRMRCSFNIAGTETYRFSSSKNAFGSGLNLQNIPKGGDDDEGLELPNIRSLFVPDPGYTFFDIDLDSADLRIVAWESDEREMKAMVKEGKKVYVEVMKEYYHNPAMTKHSPQYGMFKSYCHGTHYLGTAKGLAERLGLLVHESEKLQKWYFGKFPNIKKWQDEIKDQVCKRRYIENVFGYRVYFFDRIEGTIFNQAIAWIPQSSVACLINRGYERIDRLEKGVDILLQVHDSLAGQFPTAQRDYYVKRIVECAEIELPYPGDPLIIPVGVKTSEKSWGDCE